MVETPIGSSQATTPVDMLADLAPDTLMRVVAPTGIIEAMPAWGQRLWQRAELFALVLCACASTGCGADDSEEPSFLTVAEVSSRASALDGEEIAVRGWSRLSVHRTYVYCDPPRCNCNTADATFSLCDEPGELRGSCREGIRIPPLSCTGDDCDLACSPFNPEASPAFEFVGTLHVSTSSGGVQRLGLDDVDLGASSQLSGSDDLRKMTTKAVATGTFRVSTD